MYAYQMKYIARGIGSKLRIRGSILFFFLTALIIPLLPVSYGRFQRISPTPFKQISRRLILIGCFRALIALRLKGIYIEAVYKKVTVIRAARRRSRNILIFSSFLYILKFLLIFKITFVNCGNLKGF